MLSRETKVGVKNKENETACFIEIEGLLNSSELISDLPGLGLGAPQSQGREQVRVREELPALSCSHCRDWKQGLPKGS